jgi:hypothetical protein
MSADMKPNWLENIKSRLSGNAWKALGLALLHADNKSLKDCPGIAALRPPEFLPE